MEEPKGIVRHIQTLQDPVLSRSYRGHDKATHALSFDPQMRQLASGGADSIVYVYSFKPQGRPFKFNGHKGPVYAVQFSPDGQLIASAGEDRTIRLWKNSVMGKCTAIKGHIGSVRSLSFSPDSSFIVSASDDKTVKGWSTLKHNFLFSLAGHTNWVRSAKLAPDARLVLSGSDDSTVRLWDVETSKELYKFREFKEPVYTIDWISDGTAICAGSIDGRVKLWDARSMRLIQYYEASTKAINSLSVHSSGNYLLSGDNENHSKIFDLRQGRLAWTMYSHKAPVKVVEFNRAGDYFASAGADSNVLVWKSNFDENMKPCNVVHFVEAQQVSEHSATSMGYSAGVQVPQTTFKVNKGYNPPDAQVNRSDDGKLNQSAALQKPTKSDMVAQALAGKFEKIVSQMETVTQMIARLDKKIETNEESVRLLLKDDRVRGLLQHYEENYKEPYQRAAVWENYKQRATIPQVHVHHEGEDQVFGTGSFMRDGLLEDFAEESEKKLQQEYEEEKRLKYGDQADENQIFTQTFNVTNNPFQSGALHSTLNQHIQTGNTLQTLTQTHQTLQEQLQELGNWRADMLRAQQEPQEDNEHFIREVDEEEEDQQHLNQQNQQGEQVEVQEEEHLVEEDFEDEQGNQGEEEIHQQDQGAQD